MDINEPLSFETSKSLLSRVKVRPVKPTELSLWANLMSCHHYLGYKGLIGEAIRYVATIDECWVALIGWGSAALHCEARDQWLNWRQQIKLPRLKFIANNLRFLILPNVRLPNLASKILSVNLQRLPQDWEHYHGHPVLLVETFVDPERYLGTCYKASNWQLLGKTKGFRKCSVNYYRHGKPKLVYIRLLRRDAKKLLTGIHLSIGGPLKMKKFTKEQIRALKTVLLNLPDCRRLQGIRHPYHAIIAISICAVLAGNKSYQAIAEYAQRLTQAQLKQFHTYYDRKKRCFVPPSEPTIRRMIQSSDAQIIDDALNNWLLSLTTKNKEPIAIDGKVLKGARDPEGHQVHLLSAVLQNEGVIVAQRKIQDKTNEITQVEPLLDTLDIKDRVITLDALHTQKKTATYIVKKKKADYLLIVKDNQPTLKKDIQTLQLESFPPSSGNPG